MRAPEPVADGAEPPFGPLSAWRRRRVAVVGLGLVGGSWAAAASPLVGEVEGCDPDPAARRTARGRGLVRTAHARPGRWLRRCHLVVLAVPPGAAAEVAAACLEHMEEGGILTDVCSVKEAVVRRIGPLVAGRGVFYVPGHPLAGRERSGPAAASADLFRGAPYVLGDPAPPGRAGEAAWREVAALVAAMGARPLRLGAGDHDRLAAASSHLPYLAAVALARTLAEVEAGGVPACALASSGFRDSTRVALSPPALWGDILCTNPALGEVAALFLRQFSLLLGAVEGGPGRLAPLLEEGRRVRSALDPGAGAVRGRRALGPAMRAAGRRHGPDAAGAAGRRRPRRGGDGP